MKHIVLPLLTLCCFALFPSTRVEAISSESITLDTLPPAGSAFAKSFSIVAPLKPDEPLKKMRAGKANTVSFLIKGDVNMKNLKLEVKDLRCISSYVGNGVFNVIPKKEGSGLMVLVEKMESGEERFLGRFLVTSVNTIERDGSKINDESASIKSDQDADSQEEAASNHQLRYVDFGGATTLYLYAENRLPYSYVGFEEAGCSIRLKGKGKLETRGGNQVSIWVDGPGDVDIEVVCDSAGREVVNPGYRFKTAMLPNPKLSFAGKTQGRVRASKIKDAVSLATEFQGIPFDVPTTVKSYQLNLVTSEGEQFSWNLSSKELPKDVTKTLSKSANAGSVIFFDEIKVQLGSEPKTRTIKGLVLRVD